MMRPEKDAPERLYGACGLKDLAGHGRVSGKEFLSGRKRAAAKPRPGTRTALYMRVSTADQKPDLQSDDLRGYAARAGLDVVQDYCDVAVSGRREGRPQLNALMAAARNHAIDCVLVWKFDRFARSTRHLLTALEEFDHLGGRFVSVQDQIDTDSPMGRAMFTIIGAMAELESSLISERVTAGMRAAEARGKHLGRPAIPKRVISEIEALAISTDLSDPPPLKWSALKYGLRAEGGSRCQRSDIPPKRSFPSCARSMCWSHKEPRWRTRSARSASPRSRMTAGARSTAA